jgi:hypothetical protein
MKISHDNNPQPKPQSYTARQGQRREADPKEQRVIRSHGWDHAQEHEKDKGRWGHGVISRYIIQMSREGFLLRTRTVVGKEGEKRENENEEERSLADV